MNAKRIIQGIGLTIGLTTATLLTVSIVQQVRGGAKIGFYADDASVSTQPSGLTTTSTETVDAGTSSDAQ